MEKLTLNDILTEQELMEMFHLKDYTLKNLRYKKLLPYSKIGKTNIYLVSDILALIEKNYVSA